MGEELKELNPNNIILEQLDKLNYKDLEHMMKMSDFSSQNPFQMPSISELAGKLINGQVLIDPGSIFQGILHFFMSETSANLLFFSEIVALCIIASLLKSASGSLGENNASGIGGMVCNYVAVALCIGNFNLMYHLVGSAINEMITFMQATLPVMITLMIGSGNVASGAVFNPVILAVINIFATVAHMIILPAIFLSCSFFLINSLTESDYIKKLANFTRQFAIFIMGLSVMVFSGLTAVQGLVTAPADSVIAKTAKYSIGNFVPIIGGFAADSLDLIRSCTLVIKSAVGAFGILAILFILLVPAIKLLVAMVIYKIAAIIIEPIGNKNISDCMNEMGNTMITLLLVLFLVTLMFLIFLAMLASFGKGGIF